MRISDWSSDVCSSDLSPPPSPPRSRSSARSEASVPCSPRASVTRSCGPSGWRMQEWTRREVLRGPGVRHRRRSGVRGDGERSEEHTSELQSLMRISYAVFCLKKKKNNISDEKIHVYAITIK